MDPISIEDLALLEVLKRIDDRVPLQSTDSEIRQRLFDSGLAEEEEEGSDILRLTTAGIELCKSLQHRVAADAQAAKVVEKRKAEEAGKAEGPGNGSAAGQAAAAGRPGQNAATG